MMESGNSNRLIGRVARLVVDRGFGFIRGDEGKDYFFHASELENCEMGEIQAGLRATFIPLWNERAQGWRATNVLVQKEDALK